jgi:hypothetical protein
MLRLITLGLCIRVPNSAGDGLQHRDLHAELKPLDKVLFVAVTYRTRIPPSETQTSLFYCFLL